MRVFVAGASGAIGTPLVRQLVAGGHEVTGMTRREERAEKLRADGAEAVVCDVYDAERLSEVVVAAQPEVVVHLLTALPPRFSPKANLEPTNRVRTEGTRNLLAAAQAAGCRRLVAESVAFLYAPRGERVKHEDAELFLDAPGSFAATVGALVDLECQVGEAEGIEGVVLRYGFLYGPGTYYASDGSAAADTRKRRAPVVGEGTGVFSFVHVDDAASATVAALERGAPGAYNVVDDEPAPLSEWQPAYAQALGAKPPRRVPVWLARLVAGGSAALMATQLRGASNAKAKRELGWQPAHPSWRQGFADSLG